MRIGQIEEPQKPEGAGKIEHSGGCGRILLVVMTMIDLVVLIGTLWLYMKIAKGAEKMVLMVDNTQQTAEIKKKKVCLLVDRRDEKTILMEVGGTHGKIEQKEWKKGDAEYIEVEVLIAPYNYCI